MADENNQTPPTEVTPSPAAPTAAPSSAPATPEPTPPSLLNDGIPPPPVETAPEKYEEFKVPEGYKLDDEASKEFGALAKDMKLSQKNAQALVDFYVAKTQEAFAAPFNAYKDMTEKWVSEVKADPEIGPKLDQVKTTIGRALDGLGDPKLAGDFRAAMDLTGAGNHPAFIRTFYKLAQMVTEGGAVRGGGPSPHGQNVNQSAGRPSIAQALYPNLPTR